MKGLKLGFIVFVLTVCIGLIAGCSGGDSSSGGGSSGGDTSGAVEGILTGSWNGSWTSLNGNGSGNISANIIHGDSSIIGSISMTDYPCMSRGSLSGTVLENNVNIIVVFATNTIVYSALYTSTSISGAYAVTAGDCTGDVGTFSINK